MSMISMEFFSLGVSEYNCFPRKGFFPGDKFLLVIFGHLFLCLRMVGTHEPNELDLQFFQGADDFFLAHSRQALTYDDVSLATLYSEILPRDTQLSTRLTEGVELNIPIISADMDTVTESRMAIGMALNGGLGLIHYNMSEKEQIAQVARVKGHVHGLIQNPVTISPDKEIGDLLQTIEKEKYTFSTFPVVDSKGKLLGVLPAHVLNKRFAAYKVTDVIIPRSKVCTILQPISITLVDTLIGCSVVSITYLTITVDCHMGIFQHMTILATTIDRTLHESISVNGYLGGGTHTQSLNKFNILRFVVKIFISITANHSVGLVITIINLWQEALTSAKDVS